MNKQVTIDLTPQEWLAQVCDETAKAAETTDEAKAAFVAAVQDDPVLQQGLAETYRPGNATAPR